MTERTSYHDFHFIMDANMRRELQGSRFFLDSPSFSALLGRLLRMLCPLLEKEHFSGLARKSRYRFVHEDKLVERCSVHVYLPEDLYQWLKLIHHDLDFYSMAQVVRWILKVFLGLVKISGGRLKQKMKDYLKSCQYKNKNYTLTKKKLRQLFTLLGRHTQNISLINLYSAQFTPTLVLKC